MASYVITEKAGRFVAGHRNTGVGTVLDLIPLAAEYELRLGTLVPADMPPLQVEAMETEPAPAAPRPEEDGGAVEPSGAGGKRKRRG